MHNPEMVAAIYLVGGSIFLVALFLASVSTFLRLWYYRRHKRKVPRLLTRDVLVKGGLVLSFGWIVVARFLPIEARTGLRDDVIWALVTTIPAAFAMCVFVYYEWFVIGHAPDESDEESTQ